MADITIPRDRLGTVRPDGSVHISPSWLRCLLQLTEAVNAQGGTSLIGDEVSSGLLYSAIDDAIGSGDNFFVPREIPDVVNTFCFAADAAQEEVQQVFIPHEAVAEVKAQPATVSPGASPATITATSNGWYIVSAGTVSALDYSRAGGSFISLGVLAGMFQVSKGDAIKITYTVAPTVYFVPR